MSLSDFNKEAVFAGTSSTKHQKSPMADPTLNGPNYTALIALNGRELKLQAIDTEIGPWELIGLIGTFELPLESQKSKIGSDKFSMTAHKGGMHGEIGGGIFPMTAHNSGICGDYISPQGCGKLPNTKGAEARKAT